VSDRKSILHVLLLAFVLTIGAWGVQVTAQDDHPLTDISIINVRTHESRTLKWNPVTHEEVRNETADGNVILTVQPKERGDAGR
jgi:hypothetical protein